MGGHLEQKNSKKERAATISAANSSHTSDLYVYRASYRYMSIVHGVSDRIRGNQGFAVGIGLGTGPSATLQVPSLKGREQAGPKREYRVERTWGANVAY